MKIGHHNFWFFFFFFNGHYASAADLKYLVFPSVYEAQSNTSISSETVKFPKNAVLVLNGNEITISAKKIILEGDLRIISSWQTSRLIRIGGPHLLRPSPAVSFDPGPGTSGPGTRITGMKGFNGSNGADGVAGINGLNAGSLNIVGESMQPEIAGTTVSIFIEANGLSGGDGGFGGAGGAGGSGQQGGRGETERVLGQGVGCKGGPAWGGAGGDGGVGGGREALAMVVMARMFL